MISRLNVSRNGFLLCDIHQTWLFFVCLFSLSLSLPCRSVSRVMSWLGGRLDSGRCVGIGQANPPTPSMVSLPHDIYYRYYLPLLLLLPWNGGEIELSKYTLGAFSSSFAVVSWFFYFYFFLPLLACSSTISPSFARNLFRACSSRLGDNTSG